MCMYLWKQNHGPMYCKHLFSVILLELFKPSIFESSAFIRVLWQTINNTVTSF